MNRDFHPDEFSNYRDFATLKILAGFLLDWRQTSGNITVDDAVASEPEPSEIDEGRLTR